MPKMQGQMPFCHALAFAPGRICPQGMDETELSPDFIFAPKRHYRTFAQHIALFWRPFSEAPRRAVGGSWERNKGKFFPFQPFNAWLSSIWIFQSFTSSKKTRILTLYFLKGNYSAKIFLSLNPLRFGYSLWVYGFGQSKRFSRHNYLIINKIVWK